MEHEWLTAFYAETARKLRAYLRAALRDSAAADDLLQESFDDSNEPFSGYQGACIPVIEQQADRG